MNLKTHEDVLIQAMVLEDRIIDYKLASMRVDRQHWLSQYFERQYQQKVAEWEKLTGRKYGNTSG